jgi:hypothetical protein
MQVRVGWRQGVLLAAVLVASLGATRVVHAQQPMTITLSVTENREPGLAGTAIIAPLPNSQVRVDIRITGLPRNDVDRPAHIHTAAGARCDNGAPITYPLTNVKVDASGVGTSTTTVTLTPDKPVTANNAYVNVHNPAQGGRGVICGNITANLSGLAAGAQPAPQRPAGAPAQPPAQRAAAAPAQPAALPRTGAAAQGDTGSLPWPVAGLAMITVLLGGAGALAYARRR